MTNPFAESNSATLYQPRATAIVIFGATGDLTSRKLIPALYNLSQDGFLPEKFVVLGVARREFSDDEFRKLLYEDVTKYSRRKVTDARWAKFAQNVFYQQVGFAQSKDYEKLRERIEKLGVELGENFHCLHYLATAPRFFGQIAHNLRSAKLVEKDKGGFKTTSIVVEKPFGHDLESARALNIELKKNFDERQIFRIDHYLGKETVQNILVFRFSNGIFEPLWNHKYVDHIQISVCETVGVESRADYFDKSGIMRDIVQNHVLQVLSLLCIEPPIDLKADSIRDEKVKVLKSIRRLSGQDVLYKSVRGQYIRGVSEGEEVCGYLEEEGVTPGSNTETYVAFVLEIDNWRWSGVPIYVRAGKRLAKRITEITVHFKKAPDALFRGLECGSPGQNVLAIQVQPKEGISLTMSSKPPGPRMRVEPVTMEFSYGHSFGVPSPEAYERLLLDAMRADATLFTRNDEIEEAWDIVMPFLNSWQTKDSPDIYTYEAGTWGPKEAAELLRPAGHRWRRL